jgi:hypothetical protein
MLGSTYRSSKQGGGSSASPQKEHGDHFNFQGTHSVINEDNGVKKGAKEYNQDFADYMTSIVTKGGGSSALAQQMSATAT